MKLNVMKLGAMNLRAMIGLFLIVGMALAACKSGAAEQPGAPEQPAKPLQSAVQRVQNPTVPEADRQALAAGNSAFALDLYAQLGQQPGNLFFSPYSISQALAMTYAGARGQTAEQMAATLHFDLPAERLHPAFNALDQSLRAASSGGSEGEAQKFQLNVANSLWGQQDYKFAPQFLDQLAMHYGAGLRLVDFQADPEAARQEINAWISRETQEKIPQAIGEGGVTPYTRLALANAIYFNADWLMPFDANNTRPLPFKRLDGSSVEVDMMSFRRPEMLAYTSGLGYQAVELPYVGNTTSMVLIVPDAGTFSDYERSLSANRLESILAALKPQTVSLVLPKFKFEGSYLLNDALTQLGMPLAFNDGADFSGMNDAGGLKIGVVIHKSFVAVDEKGTEAAAATVVLMVESSMMMDEPVRLVVDRPFIFIIREQATGTLLFVGRVLEPQS